ncbi:unnamed protein product [Zymoseptoria tritici ST99CH_1E4]|uniref:Major facilitator superfamily (MFS) profile domain-containing protein n=1 Tax=Zymoseptoria tritici ST99CH_1E4 TaxID=1276532 RepID=A0A2H1GCD9_ZYMTR|nr:unnamed protein product [Zymoseptoria tritici ST99CH_1E4]
MGFWAKRPAVLAPTPPRSKEELAFVRRLDIFLMTFGCISQVIKYLDQQNINNAYVSGMKEDLSLNGNELNYFTTTFNVAYALMLIPSQIIITWVRPSFWLSGLEVAWGIMTGLMAMVTSAKQVYIIRAFLGAFESSAWPGMMTILMHWYTPMELAKRMGFYHSCQSVGNMLSGALQAAIMKTLDGNLGLAGWRWLFVINSIMTVIWGFAGIWMLPDYPNKTNPRAFWFSSADKDLAVARLLRHKRAEARPVTLASARRTFSNWLVYFIPILYAGTVLATYGYNYFGLFLKSLTKSDGSKRWTTEQVNLIPIGGSAINMVFVWFWAVASDVLQTRWTLIVAQGVICLIPCIVMSVWTSHPTQLPISAAYASYFINFMCLGTAPLIMSWLSDLIPQDPEARSLIVGVAIATYYAIGAWSQVLVWPASQAPYYKFGWQSALAIWVLCIAMTIALRYIDVRWMMPKRLAFAEGIERGEISVAGQTAVEGVVADVEESVDGNGKRDGKKDAEVQMTDDR